MHNNKLLEKDYKIEKGEVLEGSALLKKQDSNTSRVKYMIENINDNKAFEDFLKKYKDKNIAKQNFIQKFVKYRASWNDLPKYLIENKYDNEWKKSL